jgi:hypothetical protein
MSDLDKARQLFQSSGLPFPEIPKDLAVRLKERGEWLLSTREIEISPYDLYHYVDDCDDPSLEDYAILCHSGHGEKSSAIQYYLVHGNLQMFLQLAWGGVHMDAQRAAADIGWCFGLADEIDWTMNAVQRPKLGRPFIIVGSDFHLSYWSAPGKARDEEEKSPGQVLAEALQWLKQ